MSGFIHLVIRKTVFNFFLPLKSLGPIGEENDCGNYVGISGSRHHTQYWYNTFQLLQASRHVSLSRYVLFHSLQTQMKYSEGKILFQRRRLPISTTLNQQVGMAGDRHEMKFFLYEIILTSSTLFPENNKRSEGKGPRLPLDGALILLL